MNQRTVIYTRISKFRTDQTSTPTQEAEARKLAASKGWDVVAVFCDPGKSAYKPHTKRPGWNAAMNMIETKQADVFLVWKIDRFYRSMTEFAKAFERIQNAGGAFSSVMEPHLETTSAMGRYQMMGYAAMAEIESENRSQRAIPHAAYRAENGFTPGGPRPFGYERPEKKKDQKHSNTLVLKKDEAKVLQLIATGLLDGMSLRGLMKKHQPQMNGKPVSTLTITRALKSPTTAALRRHGSALVPGCWPPILERYQWEEVCELLSEPSRRTGSTNQIRHLLSGIMICQPCKKPIGVRKWKMNAKTHNLKSYEGYRYVCAHCSNSVKAEVAENEVVSLMLEAVDEEAWNVLRTSGRGYDPEVRNEIQARQMKIDQMFFDGKLSPERYEAMNDAFNRELASIDSGEPLDIPEWESLRGGWDTGNVIDQRRVLKVIFTTITLEPANGRRDPASRVHLDWRF